MDKAGIITVVLQSKAATEKAKAENKKVNVNSFAQALQDATEKVLQESKEVKGIVVIRN